MNYKELDLSDMMVIKDSLEYFKYHIENHDNSNYPDYAIKREKIDNIEKALEKVRDIIRD